jgi:hypothetical protein
VESESVLNMCRIFAQQDSGVRIKKSEEFEVRLGFTSQLYELALKIGKPIKLNFLPFGKNSGLRRLRRRLRKKYRK